MKYDRSTIYRAYRHAHQTQDWNQSENLRQTRFYVEELEQRIMLDGAVASALVEHIPVTENSLSALVLDAHSQEEFRFVNGRWVLPAETEAMVQQDREFWNARAAAGGGEASAPESAPLPLADTFKLHSNPTATKTIYLDFDGNTTTGTSWNSRKNRTIVSPAYDPDGNGAAFTDNELNRIQRIWHRVAEDYSPFNVNVTTEYPGDAALVNTGGTDTQWGIRVVVTGKDFANCRCGGFAYLDSFNWGYESAGATDTPVFVFNTSELGVWAAATHEVGHAVGLSHDGTTSANPIQPNSAYYNGHGSGETSWGPIMGSGYYANVTTWDHGEYIGANNGQDDIAIITRPQNGFGLRADDHGDNRNSASWVNIDPNLVDVALFGIIEDRADLDFIKFETGAGTVNFTINSYVNQVWTSNGDGTYSNSIEGTFYDGANWPNNQGSNLDVAATLYDSRGNQIASSNPTGLSAGFSNLYLDAGTYYISVDGVGFGSPFASPPTGYTDYASIGQYYVSGTVQPTGLTLSAVAEDADKLEGNSGTTPFTFNITMSQAQTQDVTVHWAVTGSGTSPADTADFGGSFPSGQATIVKGVTSVQITVNVTGDLFEEDDETFVVTLSNPTLGQVSAAAIGTIRNDDDQTRPTITSPGPAITADAGVSSVRVTFDEAIDVDTFTAVDDVTFTDPSGSAITNTVTEVAGSNGREFDINFDPLVDPGAYDLTIGPNIEDLAGNEMDQPFTTTLTVNPVSEVIEYNSGVVNLPISERIFQTESRITINDNFIIGDVDVVVKINHKYDGQLDINLVPPWGWNGGYSGTHPYTGGSLIGPVLSWQNGGSGDNYADTRFDDEASLSIKDGSAPFIGSYRPEVPLSTLTVSEHRVQGSWTLLVYDRGNRYSGTLVSWELHITPASGSSFAAIESEARTVESESSTVESGQSAALRSTVSLPANVAESTSLLFAPPSQALQPEQAMTTPESPATSTNGRHQNAASLQVLHVPVPGGKLNPLLQKEGLRRVDAEVLDSIGIQFF